MRAGHQGQRRPPGAQQCQPSQALTCTAPAGTPPHPPLHLALLPLELGRPLVLHNDVLPLRVERLHVLLCLGHVLVEAEVVRNVLGRLEEVVVGVEALRLGEAGVHVLQADVLEVFDIVRADVDLAVDLAAVKRLFYVVGLAAVDRARWAARHRPVVEDFLHTRAASAREVGVGWGGVGGGRVNVREVVKKKRG